VLGTVDRESPFGSRGGRARIASRLIMNTVDRPARRRIDTIPASSNSPMARWTVRSLTSSWSATSPIDGQHSPSLFALFANISNTARRVRPGTSDAMT
jgi:hypothetical protein